MNLDDEPTTPTPLTGQQRIERIITYMIGTCIVTLFLTVGSCTMHSNSIDPARLKEEATIKEAEAKLSAQRLLLEKEQLKTLERLINQGINPIAARCAVEGWDKNRPDVVCVSAVNSPNTKRPE